MSGPDQLTNFLSSFANFAWNWKWVKVSNFKSPLRPSAFQMKQHMQNLKQTWVEPVTCLRRSPQIWCRPSSVHPTLENCGQIAPPPPTKERTPWKCVESSSPRSGRAPKVYLVETYRLYLKPLIITFRPPLFHFYREQVGWPSSNMMKIILVCGAQQLHAQVIRSNGWEIVILHIFDLCNKNAPENVVWSPNYGFPLENRYRWI